MLVWRVHGMMIGVDDDEEQQSAPCAVLQIDGVWQELSRPAGRFVARHPEDVPGLLAAVEAAADSGLHVAGYVAYEAGAAFGLACHPAADGLPLAEFVAFERMAALDVQTLALAASRAPTLDWRTETTEDGHASAVARIRKHLAAGETYQVNLTYPLRADWEGEPFAFFARLARAQRSSCAAYLDFGRLVVCSASPEVFFSRDGDRVVMRPMKGTSARGRTLAEDRGRAAALRRSPKERAENLMIVDMVRNDLGRLARPGSVRVDDLFRVERYPTVLQMTSTVSAELSVPLAELFGATFPCASVVGAPKVRTAELIRDLEPGPRGIYTGAVGYVGPARKARFNVAIRTATIDRERKRATYGTGSGIVWDSRPGREFRECAEKTRVLTAGVQPFQLLETLRWDPDGGYALLGRHLRRQAGSAKYFGIPYNRVRIREVLAAEARGDVPLRVRLLVSEEGETCVESEPLLPNATEPVRVGLSRLPSGETDVFRYHKTTHRQAYDDAMASRPDCDQALLWTADGIVIETNIANVAVQRAGRWVTPPAADGLLAGTYRAELLAQGALTEAHVTVEEVRGGVPLAVFNSLRGWQPAVFVPVCEV